MILAFGTFLGGFAWGALVVFIASVAGVAFLKWKGFLVLLVVLCAASAAEAQCPGGRCQRPILSLAAPRLCANGQCQRAPTLAAPVPQPQMQPAPQRSIVVQRSVSRTVVNRGRLLPILDGFKPMRRHLFGRCRFGRCR